MNLLDEVLVNNVELDERLETYIESFDDYSDPYIFCLQSAQHQQSMIVELLERYNNQIFCLDDTRLFFFISSNKIDSKIFVKSIIDQCTDSEAMVFMSIFHHNAIGSLWETLDWGLQLLQQASEASKGESNVLFNDFMDKNTWPGVEQYREY